MMKFVLHGIVLALLTVALTACTSPEEKAADYIANADKLFAEGNLSKAQVEYKTALQINQNLPGAWYGLAKIHERKREWKEVYSTLNRVREMSPGHVDARIMLGHLLLASNQLNELLIEAREIREMAPDDARSHSLMAALQFRLENFDGALDAVDKALLIDPLQADALLVRARVLIAEKRYDDASAELDRAIAKAPENAGFYLMKIKVFSEQGDRQAVKNVYLAMIDQFPEDLRVKQALARHYLEDKNIDAAERILRQIADSETTSVDHRIRLVQFKQQYRSLDEAIVLVNSYIAQAGGEYRFRFLLGELYELSQQVDKAKEVYTGIVADDGIQTNGLEARNKIAEIELRAGERDNASALINEVLAEDKSNVNGMLLQARLQLVDGKIDDAIVIVRTVLRDNPDSLNALSVLGHAYSASGSTDLAIESFMKAFQLVPGNSVITNQLAAILLRERKTVQADEVLQESFASGNRSVDSLKLAAQAKLLLGQWDKAEQLAMRLQKSEGQEAVSQELLGEAYRGKEDDAASIRAFQRAHELSPESEKSISSLVRAYLESGNVDEAKVFLNSVLEFNSDSMIAYLLLGQVSLYENDFPQAIRHFNKMIEIDPKSDVAYRRLNAIYVNQNDLEKAEIVTRQGLSSIPESTILGMNLAQLYEMSGDFAKAMQIYDNLLKIDADLIVAKNNLASLLTDYGDGQDSFEKARVVAADLKNSEIPQFRDTYAWASVVAGTNLEEAVVILEGILRENAQVGVYNYHLGEAYRRKGDSESAIAYLNKAIELAGPGTDIAKKARQSLQQIK